MFFRQLTKMLSPNFNSIKVQLKPQTEHGFDGSFLFQFHKGTIKAKHRSMSKGSNFISIP